MLICLEQSCEYKKENAMRHEGYDFSDTGGFACFSTLLQAHDRIFLQRKILWDYDEWNYTSVNYFGASFCLYAVYFQWFSAGTFSV